MPLCCTWFRCSSQQVANCMCTVVIMSELILTKRKKERERESKIWNRVDCWCSEKRSQSTRKVVKKAFKSDKTGKDVNFRVTNLWKIWFPQKFTSCLVLFDQKAVLTNFCVFLYDVLMTQTSFLTALKLTLMFWSTQSSSLAEDCFAWCTLLKMVEVLSLLWPDFAPLPVQLCWIRTCSLCHGPLRFIAGLALGVKFSIEWSICVMSRFDAIALAGLNYAEAILSCSAVNIVWVQHFLLPSFQRILAFHGALTMCHLNFHVVQT